MSSFTSRQHWLSRQEAALNPHTLYSSYAHDPTSPPLHLVVLLYSQQHTLKTRTAFKKQTLLLLLIPLLILQYSMSSQAENS